MKTIRYGDSSFVLRLEFPSSWPVKTLCPTAVTIAVEDGAGTELLAATATTILEAHNTGALVAAGAASMALAATPPAYAAGDRLLLVDGVTAPSEILDVAGISGTTLYLRDGLTYDHATAKALRPLFVTYALDASDADDFPRGSERLLIWTPNDDNPVYKEQAIVESAEWGGEGLEADMTSFPTAYELIKDRYNKVEAMARRTVTAALRFKDLDIDTLRDPQILIDPMLHQMRILAYQGTDALDRYAEELKDARASYASAIKIAQETIAWWDADRDDDKDENEVTAAQLPVFAGRGY